MMNLRNFGDEPPRQIEGGGNGGRIPSNLPLTRQPSVYALTFDELQSTMGGMGKDFGSMNMDELLKNIWSADETQQSVPSSSGRPEGGGIVGGGNLQKQGSLTLPRTLSQKTVDEVWKDISGCEYSGRKDEKGNGRPNLQQQRQQTLGEMTLEEFLVRAGVVREDITQFAGKPNPINVLGFPQIDRGSGLMGNRILDSNNQIAMQSLNLPLNNVNGVRPSQQQPQQQQQQQQQLFSQQTTATYTSPGMRGGIVGISDPAMNSNLVPGAGLQQGGGMGVVGLGGGAANVAAASPTNQLSPDGIGRSNEETSSVSPAPYMFNGGMRGRKRSGAVEKVVERRQRRMIKNRESAARSRARKQAYTMELEAEVSKLKEENEELRKKQAEMENQKNQVLEMMQSQQGRKKRCLRRTQSGHW